MAVKIMPQAEPQPRQGVSMWRDLRPETCKFISSETDDAPQLCAVTLPAHAHTWHVASCEGNLPPHQQEPNDIHIPPQRCAVAI